MKNDIYHALNVLVWQLGLPFVIFFYCSKFLALGAAMNYIKRNGGKLTKKERISDV